MIGFIVDEQILRQLTEYLDHLQRFLQDNFAIESQRILYKRPENCLIDESKYQVIIFVQQMSQIILNRIPKTTARLCLLNTEQATVPMYRNRTIQQIRQFKPTVIDYSLENIDILRKSCDFVQYIYMPFPINIKFESKVHRVTSLGNSIQRSHEIQRIRQTGIPVVDFSGKWGSERDDIISKSKVLANIHWSREYAIFESIRCYQALETQTLVVSQSSHNPDLLLLKDWIIFAKNDEFPQQVKHVLENYYEYQQKLFNPEQIERIRKMFLRVYQIATTTLGYSQSAVLNPNPDCH